MSKPPSGLTPVENLRRQRVLANRLLSIDDRPWETAYQRVNDGTELANLVTEYMDYRGWTELALRIVP